MNEYVHVAVPVGVRKTFTYSVPPGFRGRIAAGMRVIVPFGRKLVTGYVTGFTEASEVRGFRLRAVEELIDPEPAVPAQLVETALWVARYYFAPPGEVFRALFPAGTEVSGSRQVLLTPKAATLLRGGLRPPGLKPQENALLDLLDQGKAMTVRELADRSGIKNIEAWLESLSARQFVQLDTALESPRVKSREQLAIRALPVPPELLESLTPAQKRLYSKLEAGASPRPLQQTLQDAGVTLSVARSMERKGVVAIGPERIDRLPPDLAESADFKPLVLTPSQRELVDGILAIIQRREAARCLIHGVTGSGKTEVYLRIIAEVLRLGGTAMFLVPEIGLTPMLSRLVVSRFPGEVSLLHSGMSAGERFDQWTRIRSGSSRVVVGTRSAVFAPLEDLRLVVIDEEQDSSYKQDDSPCYHARDVAWHRVSRSNGVLLMGSATPSMETYFSAVSRGDRAYFRLPERIDAKPLPEVTVVDMTVEFQRHGKNTVLSQTLEEELQNCMRRGEQAIVLLNRRGYSRTLLCRSCGHVYACPECSVSMTYHREENRLTCHYCGAEKEVPSLCANCGGPYIYYLGVGTEQLESLLRQLLPKARIARLDSDTARRRGVLRTTLFNFAQRKLDILVGTQILAKGHDFPDVTLVGVVAADAGLSFPDFRSAERTFQLLTQVAGRAGRGSAPGRVVLQSFHPDNYALLFARRQDYHGFFEREIEFRRLMGYPPFTKLVQILISDADSAKASRTADKIADVLREKARGMEERARPRVLGPAPAPLEKLRGKYRFQILMKWPLDSDHAPLLEDCFEYLARHRVSAEGVHVDVDPLSLL